MEQLSRAGASQLLCSARNRLLEEVEVTAKSFKQKHGKNWK